MIDTTIRNPGNEAHRARIKPVGRLLRVRRGETVLAESRRAVRLMETGRDLYDPVIYVPEADLVAALTPVEGKSTHCPLKGDASYLAFDGTEIAWTYDRPLEGSRMLRGLVAFDAEKVVIEEIGADA